MRNRKKAKALALPPPMTVQDLLLSALHAALALSIPLLLALLLGGCKAEELGEPVDYGPEVTAEEVMSAISAPVATSVPTETKVGAFVHFIHTQTVAAGQYTSLLGETGQGISAREDVGDAIKYTLRERRITYSQGEVAQDLVREFNLYFDKPGSTSASSLSVDAGPENSTLSLGEGVRLSEQRKAAGARLLRSFLATKDKVEQLDTKVTYHKLETAQFRAPPPKLVAQIPGCLGIPDCLITYNKISFDQVFWDDPAGERIHFDFVVSPNVPQTSGYNMSALFGYYPGLVNSCVTLMVAVGDGRSKTLLTECQDVINFRFESSDP